MLEDKELQKKLDDIDIEIKNLKVNKNFSYSLSALALVNGSCSLVQSLYFLLGNTNTIKESINFVLADLLIMGISLVVLDFSLNNCKTSKDKISNLKFIKEYLLLPEDKKYGINEIDDKLPFVDTKEEFDNLKSLREYLTTDSIKQKTLKRRHK